VLDDLEAGEAVAVLDQLAVCEAPDAGLRDRASEIMLELADADLSPPP